MQLLTGIIVDGKVVLNGGELPDGTAVTVFTKSTEDREVLPPPLLAELNEALAEADAEEDEGISPDELFHQLSQRF